MAELNEPQEQDDDEAQEEAPKFKAEKWKCPACGMSITTYVPLNGPPTCGNPSKHTTKKIEMELVKGK
jgi:hypothetical protein